MFEEYGGAYPGLGTPVSTEPSGDIPDFGTTTAPNFGRRRLLCHQPRRPQRAWTGLQAAPTVFRSRLHVSCDGARREQNQRLPMVLLTLLIWAPSIVEGEHARPPHSALLLRVFDASPRIVRINSKYAVTRPGTPLPIEDALRIRAEHRLVRICRPRVNIQQLQLVPYGRSEPELDG